MLVAHRHGHRPIALARTVLDATKDAVEAQPADVKTSSPTPANRACVFRPRRARSAALVQVQLDEAETVVVMNKRRGHLQVANVQSPAISFAREPHTHALREHARQGTARPPVSRIRFKKGRFCPTRARP